MFGWFLLIFIGALTWLIYWGLKRKNYWRDHGVPHVESPIFWGTFGNPMFMKESVTSVMQRIYKHPNSKGQPFVGVNVFYKPAIFVRDPELVKRIMVKDFNDFSTRFTSGDPVIDPIGANNLFQVKNPIWRGMRTKLTPVFTSGKMRQWFRFVEIVGNNLNKRLHKMTPTELQQAEIRLLAGFYTLDGISLVALATETNSLSSEKPTDLLVAISKAWNVNYWRKIQINMVFFLQDLIRLFKVTTFSKAFDDFVRDIFNDAYNHRVQSGTTRGDLIDALIAVKKAEENEEDSSKGCRLIPMV